MENKEELEIQLFSSLNEYEVQMVCSMLEENNIPYVRRDNGSGSYMNLYMGQSIQEKRIFVSKEDYEKSLEIIEPILTNNEIEETTEKNNEEDNEKNKYHSIKFLFGLLMIGIPVIMVLIVIMAVI